MRSILSAVLLTATLGTFAVAASAAPTPAAVREATATVDPSTIPDGTYTVTVEKVLDSEHIVGVMTPGNMTAVLASGRPTVSFASVKEGDSLKVSTGKGMILVFLDLGPANK